MIVIHILLDSRFLNDKCTALEEPESVILYFLRPAQHKMIE